MVEIEMKVMWMFMFSVRNIIRGQIVRGVKVVPALDG